MAYTYVGREILSTVAGRAMRLLDRRLHVVGMLMKDLIGVNRREVVVVHRCWLLVGCLLWEQHVFGRIGMWLVHGHVDGSGGGGGHGIVGIVFMGTKVRWWMRIAWREGIVLRCIVDAGRLRMVQIVGIVVEGNGMVVVVMMLLLRCVVRGVIVCGGLLYVVFVFRSKWR